MQSNLQIFGDRFHHARSLIREHIPRRVRRGAFLDIGCGTGNGVAAALACGARSAVGVDIDFSLFAHDLDWAEFPEVCRKFGADSRRAVMIEADLLSLGLRPGSFDYCLMLDCAEHLPSPDRFIARGYDLLAPGGYLLLSASPLFWSVAGHHLFHLFDRNREPWSHLTPDFEAQALSRGCTEWHLAGYRGLNRVTADELVDAFQRVGFELLRADRNPKDPEHVRLLGTFGDRIDPALKVERQWLLEEWLLVVARKR